jgi:hypothetical protein
MRCVDILHQQIMHIIVLVVELVKTNISQSKESKM